MDAQPPAEQQQPERWSMGLRGWVAQVANLTAVGVLCFLFYAAQQQQFAQQREDRQMFRQELAAQREQVARDSERQWEAIRGLAEEIKRLREAKGP